MGCCIVSPYLKAVGALEDRQPPPLHIVSVPLFARLPGTYHAQASIPQQLPELTYFLALLPKGNFIWQGSSVLIAWSKDISYRTLLVWVTNWYLFGGL
jgi:hypothetical protein